MAKPPAAEVDAGGRAVRVSSPDRVIYEATDRSPEVTKLMVAEFFASVGDGLMRALRDRPTALERWTSGVRPGMRLATGPQDKDADAFYQKRVPKGAPDYLETVQVTFPSGRTADEICPTEIAVPVWCAHMGTLVFHPWPVRRGDVDHPDELRIDLDPQPGVRFAQVREAAAEVRTLLDELGIDGRAKTTGSRGIHVYVALEARWDAVAVRQAAVALARELERRRPDLLTAAWWKEERGTRVFVDFNQNAPHKTVFGAWSARARTGAQVSCPFAWDDLDAIDPEACTVATVPERLAAGGDPWAGMRAAPQTIDALLGWFWRDIDDGLMDAPWPPVYPKMPLEPPRVAPSRAAKPDDEA